MINAKRRERVLPHEARMQARRLERKSRRMLPAAEREPVMTLVIPADPDDALGDLISLLLNSKPANLSMLAWLQEIERRGGPCVETVRRWLRRKTKNPQCRTRDWFLQAIGKRVYIGDL